MDVPSVHPAGLDACSIGDTTADSIEARWALYCTLEDDGGQP